MSTRDQGNRPYVVVRANDLNTLTDEVSAQINQHYVLMGDLQIVQETDSEGQLYTTYFQVLVQKSVRRA